MNTHIAQRVFNIETYDIGQYDVTNGTLFIFLFNPFDQFMLENYTLTLIQNAHQTSGSVDYFLNTIDEFPESFKQSKSTKFL